MQGIVRHTLRNLNSMDAVDDVIAASKAWVDGDTVILDFQRLHTTWPDTTVSLAAALDYLRTHRRMKFIPDHLHFNQSKTWLHAPRAISELSKNDYPTNVVWRYDSEREAQLLADAFMKSLTDLVVCESGVIDTLNWCIYEVLDNVFQHSHADRGFVMMQVHTRNRTCVLGVTDTGRGIHRAMVDAAHGSSVDPTRVRTADSAIAHALEQGVTSKGKDNQGNGLHGLRRAVEINGGQLSVRSGRGSWRYRDAAVTTAIDVRRPLLDANSSHSTTVDWRLDCAKAVSINEALGRPEIESAVLEAITTAEDYYRIDATELEALVGSRQHGSEVRTRIRNYVTAGAGQVVLDLRGIPLVSSSFADEVMGKLALEMGELEFRRTIFVDGASPVNRGLIERAIELRLQSGT
ncbi:hypothetical protein CXR34_16110 [Microbacterium hominis]|uniref:Histidine kinase/HSP90-like ATPase domain-containing protein n=2 Tax=Microbacteriaceae TaxID=85023 RepID=A0A2K9DY89_9MICO|nr:hypothetical protein CXR34_16110 [Microbacterium hominis]